MTVATHKSKRSLTKTLGNYSFVLIFAFILIAYLIINAGATTLNGVMNILRHSAVVGIMAFGMGLVIITGGIDLSVGSMLSLIGGLGVVAFNASNSVLPTLLTVVLVGCVRCACPSITWTRRSPPLIRFTILASTRCLASFPWRA